MANTKNNDKKKYNSKKRRFNAKGRKLIRRVIAGLLMISALGIAAIPTDRSGIVMAANESLDYDGDSSLVRNGDLQSPSVSSNSFLDVSKISNDDIYNSYEVRQIDGSWTFLWKYKYYVPSEVGGVTNVGVVCGYNDTYEVNSLNLSGEIYTCYDFVSSADYNSYLQNTLNNTRFLLDVSPTADGTNTKLSEVKKYFKNEFEQWEDLYYQKLSEYQVTNPENTHPTLTEIGMAALDLSGSEMSEDLKAVYYCDHTGRQGYSLESVKNLARKCTYRDSNGQLKTIPDEDNIYIARVYDDSANTQKIDENSFQYKEGMSIIAIAESAFANTAKVNSMSVGESVAYIGDSAFENSFIQQVKFSSVIYIGNRVFKGCQYLNEVNLAQKTEIIGKEAFEGCKVLQQISIPAGVKEIGFGAFANCSILTDVSLRDNHGANVGEYAFYNCPLLENVAFPENYEVALGKADFALSAGSGTNATLTKFSFPKNIKKYVSACNGETYSLNRADGSEYEAVFGDYMFANRNHLDTVTMPTNFGSSDTEIIPSNTFEMCIDLGSLVFDKTSNGYASFDSDLFEDVENSALFVFGPPTCNKTGPEGKDYAYPRRSTWECSSNVAEYVPYIYYADGKNHYEVGIDDYRYELEVNEEDNTAKLLRCEFIKNERDIDLIVPGQVAKFTIKDMETGCFDSIKPHILSLTVEDDSIETIGDGVFSGCDKLSKIDLGDSVLLIGNQSFSYNPMLKEVHIGKNIENIGNKAFESCPALNDVYFDSPADHSKLRKIENDAFYTSSDKLVFHGDMEKGYYPFEYAMANNKINSDSTRVAFKSPYPQSLTCIMDENTGYVTLIDYPHYIDLSPDIRNKYEAKMALNDEEQAALDATQYLNIPEIIESVDILSFLSPEASNPNRKNFVYVSSAVNDLNTTNCRRDIYGDDYLKDANLGLLAEYYEDNGGYKAGLFSGYMSEFPELTATNINSSGFATKGNDWIASIEMPGVKYIPDFCFDSCERLQSVIIGENCEKIGESAFQGCDQLSSIGTNNNPRYEFENYILYEKKDDGTYKIDTCLPSRGKGRTASEIWVNSTNDPKITNVSELAPGAFSSCKNIAKVELSDCKQITSIPENAFKGCTSLSSVQLPDTIKSIAKHSFDNGAPSLDITIPCDCNISDEAFDKDAITTVWTYSTCAITAAYDPVGYDQVYIKFLNQAYKITFLNDDLTKFKEIEVLEGYNGYYPEEDPVPLVPEHKGYKFTTWHFDNPNGILKVTEPRQALAVFTAPSTSENSASENDADKDKDKKDKKDDKKSESGASTNNNSASNNSASGNSASSNSASTNSVTYNVLVENGAGTGSYEAGKVVTITAYAPASGKVFDKWTTSNTDIGFSNPTNVSTTFIMPKHDVKVTATYKSASSASSNSASSNSANSSQGQGQGSTNGNNKKNNGGTEVRVTTDTIDNNKKNLAYAKVAGSTDNYVVKITDSAAASAAVEEALKKKYNNDLSNINYVAFDISLYDETGTVPIENYDGLAVTITIPIPDDLVSYAGNNMAAAVINGEIDDKKVRFSTIDGVPCMTFTATHFSPYTIYVDTAHLLKGANDFTPKTGLNIAPKWFLSLGMALVAVVLFLWKEKPRKVRKMV